ncbi:unnamed protein product [Calypogeia fissa]
MAATMVATFIAAAAALNTNLPPQLTILNSSASSSAPTRPSSSLVQNPQNPILISSGKAPYRQTSRELFASNRAFNIRFKDRDTVFKNFVRCGLEANAREGDGVTAEVSLEGLFLSSDETVDTEEHEITTDTEFLEEGGERVVYLNSWQMKKMVAASNLGARCVNVDALAAEVGLESSDVLAWLENAPSKPVFLTSTGGSYMEDVHIVEEVEEPALYVPPPPIPSRDLSMRNKVEDLMYTLKDIMSGPVAEMVTDEKKRDTMVKLFYEKVELQNPLFCSRGIDALVEWVQLLGLLGVGVKLHDIYYENTVQSPYKRWVYATWTTTLTNDLQMSVVELGLMEWWARCHLPELWNSPGSEKQHAEENQSMKNRVLSLSGECRFEMAESGQVANVHTKWYKLAEDGGAEDFMDAKLWLSGILRRGLC